MIATGTASNPILVKPPAVARNEADGCLTIDTTLGLLDSLGSLLVMCWGTSESTMVRGVSEYL